MVEKDIYQRVEAVRRFNRFYTKQIGVLHERLLRSPFPLTEARVIYELAHHEKTTATELSNELGLDAGYLSRLLRSFKKRGLIHKQPSQTDGRQNFLSLTERGQEAFAMLNARSRSEVGAMLSDFSAADQNRLVKAMHTIEGLLGAQPEHKVPYLLRPHQPGDMGWVVHRHGVLYAEEYGWDEQFEALVAGIVAKFVQHYNPKQERCWMAEMDGRDRRLGVSRQKIKNGGPTAPAAGRAKGARAGYRHPLGERMHSLRSTSGLPENRAVDQQRAACCPTHLRRSRLSPGS